MKGYKKKVFKKKLSNKILVALMVVIMVISYIVSSSSTLTVQGMDFPPPIEPRIVPTQSFTSITASPGEVVHISVPVRLTEYLNNQYITVGSEDSQLEIISDITLSRVYGDALVTDFAQNADTNVIFDVQVKETIKIGTYNLKLKVSGTDRDGIYHKDVTMDSPIMIKVKSEKSNPELSIHDVNIPQDVNAGQEFNLKFQLGNEGSLTAKDTKVSLDGFTADGIMPNYTKTIVSIGDIKQGASSDVTLSLKVADAAVAGYCSLMIKLTCKDIDGNLYPVEVPVYINILSGSVLDSDPNILITDVKQSVSSPTAGGNVTVSFYLQNKSKSDIKEIKITPTNLSNGNFSPVESEPYQYINYLNAGVKKKVKMQLKVSKDVVEGLNELDINYTYKDESGKIFGPVAANLFVLNVRNPEEDGSTPKLIISDFKTSEETLKAGSSFDFNFDVLNTNNKVNSRNIKVTLSSVDNVFSVTKGSNSFYIPVIGPGETIHNTLNLKVKSDSITKAYPIEIKFEYEYDGMPKPADGTVSTGVSVSETINLQVMENARPVVSNIMIGYGELPIANTPTSLNFEFYNLGKSVLSNVTAKIESTDFTTSSTMLFIGNVEAGSGDIQEIEIIPMIEGQAKGTLIISYEDSNGDTIEVPTEFEAMVNPMPVFNPGMEDPGMYPEFPVVKEPMVNTWVFIIIQLVLFFLAIPIGKKAKIGLYKKKLHKKEENRL